MKGTCTQLDAAQTSSNIDLRSIIDILIAVIHPDIQINMTARNPHPV